MDKQKNKTKDKGNLLNEYKEQLQRLQAEFENYIKRNEKDRQVLLEYGSKDILLKMVSLFDDFERTIKVADSCEKKELIAGLNLIFKNFKKALDEEGVKPINSIGDKFNPYKHEVIDKIECEEEEGKIIDDVQRGYMLKDKILRFSKVRISRGKKNE